MSQEERRRYPRVDQTIPVEMGLGPEVLVVETKNISCGGALCQLSQEVPLMTQLDVVFQLPSKEEKIKPVKCRGVVVRQDVKEDGSGGSVYMTAIYFSDIKDTDRQRIAEYVLDNMLS